MHSRRARQGNVTMDHFLFQSTHMIHVNACVILLECDDIGDETVQ